MTNQFLHYTDDFWTNIYWHHNGVDSRRFHGAALYLGMGTCFLPRHQTRSVTQTVIVEIDPAVIAWNQEHDHLDSGWTVIQIDAYGYEPDQAFDHIVVDIWYDQQCASVVQNLMDRYKPYLTPTGTVLNLKTVVLEHC